MTAPLPPGFELDAAPPLPPGFVPDGTGAPPAPRSGTAAIPSGLDAQGNPVYANRDASAPGPQQPAAETPLKAALLGPARGMVGIGETGLHAAGGLVGGIVGALATAVNAVRGVGRLGLDLAQGASREQIDTNQAQIPSAEQTFSAAAQQYGYEPRTEIGQAGAGAINYAVNEIATPLGATLLTLPFQGPVGPLGAALRRELPNEMPRDVAARVAAKLGAPEAVRTSQQVAAQTFAEGAKQAKLAEPKLQARQEALDAGFKLTQEAGGGSATARATESLAGKPALTQNLAAHNVENASKLGQKWVGLPEDTPLTPEATKELRAKAGEDYAAVKDVGTFTNDAQYNADLDKIVSPYLEAAKDYPKSDIAKNPILKAVDGLRVDEANTASAIEVVKDLRNEADKAFRAGDKKLGGSYRDAAQAVDNGMNRALQKMVDEGGDPALADAVSSYQAARKQIAKTYVLDDAMRSAPSGEINMAVFKRALDKGVPLDGEGLQIAKFAKEFGGQGLTKAGKGRTTGAGGLDLVLAALEGPSGIARTAAALTGRPALRAVLGSEWAQKRLAARNAAALEEGRAMQPPAPPKAGPPELTATQAPFEPQGGAPAQGAPNAAEQVPQQGSVQPERVSGNEGGQAAEAGPGDSLQRAAPGGEAPPQEPIPVGEVTYLDEPAWRKAHGLGDNDAGRAMDVRRALDADPQAVEKAAAQHERSPVAFDKAVQAIIEKAKSNENATKPAAGGSQGAETGAEQPPGAATAPGEQPGADGAAEAPTKPVGDQPGRPAEAGDEALDLGLPNIDETFMREQQRAQEVKAPALPERGLAQVRKALEDGREAGTLDADGVALALWALDRNPRLARSLKVEVLPQHTSAVAAKGSYQTSRQIVKLFEGKTNPQTAAHEILHHAERMMPEAVQQGIRREWQRSLDKAISEADGPQRAALEDAKQMMSGDKAEASAAKDRVIQAFRDKVLDPKEHYALTDPSEFWAVNAARILHERFTGRGSWRAQAVQWLNEMVEHVKGIVGVRSDAPVLKALDTVLNPKTNKGRKQSAGMLKSTDERGQFLGASP